MHHPLPPSLATIPCHHPLPPSLATILFPPHQPPLFPPSRSLSPTSLPADPIRPPLQGMSRVWRVSLRARRRAHRDVTSLATIPAGTQASAQFLAKEGGVLAGTQACPPFLSCLLTSLWPFPLPSLSSPQGTSRAWRPSQQARRQARSSWPRKGACWQAPRWLQPCFDCWSPAFRCDGVGRGTGLGLSAQFLAKEGVLPTAEAEHSGGSGNGSCGFMLAALGWLDGPVIGVREMRAGRSYTRVEWSKEDGDTVEKGEVFATVHGSAHAILQGERVALNFMQRMSGIATSTRAMVEAARPATVLETRKTAPGLRITDKWAVLIGGGQNHRVGLYDMLLVKDNHIAAAGGVPAAISSAREYIRSNGLDLPVEVEARTLDELQEVLRCRGEGVGRVTRVMLDNMVVLQPGGGDGGGAVHVDVSMLQQAVNMVNGQLETEASGNVTLETVGAIAATGVDFIS
ncbi:unnamed protein product, partial [Closterium sp. NIES-65]